MKKSEVVILGSSGFIGSYLYNFFLKNKFKIIGINRAKIDLEQKTSIQKLKKILNKNSILIITTAATREKGNTIKTFGSNLGIALNIANVLEKIKIKKCIFLSTTDVYGYKALLPISEDTPADPQSYYSVSKYLSEELLKIATSKTKTPYLIIRYNGIYGPNQKNIGYGVNFFIKSLIEKNRIEIWGKGEELRDCVYVVDLTKIIYKLALNRLTGVVNVSTGKSLSYRKLIDKLNKIHPKKITIFNKPRTTPIYNQRFSVIKLNKHIKGFTFTELLTSLKETYAFYSQHK